MFELDVESYSYRFYKNLNKDVHLHLNSDGEWDIDFDTDKSDWVIVDGFQSVENACLIAIMTRFQELGFMDLYSDFGCRVHELIKENKRKQTAYKIELFVEEVLRSMRRVRKVNWVTVIDSPDDEFYNYLVTFNVSCVVDENVDVDSYEYNEFVEGSFSI